MGNTFGHTLKITTFGESHGGGVGVVIDGFPSGIALDFDKIQAWLNRRKPGQSHLSSPRDEKDQVEVLSGVDNNITLGSPIALMVRNKNTRPDHYKDMEHTFRPSHADFSYWKKYGLKASSGGGRSSARETIGRVAAAALCEQLLEAKIPGFTVVAFVDSVKGKKANVERLNVTRHEVDQHPLRCPDKHAVNHLENIIIEAKKQGDTVGGTICCSIRGLPAGLGEPVFDKFEALLAQAMMSLPASKGFEIGSGFDGTDQFGSEHNDAFEMQGNDIRTRSNNSGGIQGGISNGEEIYFRVAFKPVSTLFKPQDTVTTDKQTTKFKPKAGRHDPCVLPRAVPMVEAMAVLVTADLLLRQRRLSPN